VREFLKNHMGLIGWAIVMTAVVWALTWQHNLAQKIEYNSIERSYQLCETQNSLKQVMRSILDTAAETGSDRSQEDWSSFNERINPLLQPSECPPLPEPRSRTWLWNNSN
jgi:hypothetical protein